MLDEVLASPHVAHVFFHTVLDLIDGDVLGYLGVEGLSLQHLRSFLHSPQKREERLRLKVSSQEEDFQLLLSSNDEERLDFTDILL